MRYYGEAVIDPGGHLFGGNGSNVAFSEAAEDLDLPLFAVFGDPSELGSPAAVRGLNFVLAPEDDFIIIAEAV